MSDELPEGWATSLLPEVVYFAGRIGWRGLKAEEYTESGAILLSVYNLNNGPEVDFTNVNYVSTERYKESPEIKVRVNDVLLTKDGAGIGKAGFVASLPAEATINSSLLLLRSLAALDPTFLFYTIVGPRMQGLVKERITGSTTPHLFQKDIKQFELLIPPLVEQQRIVAKVEVLLARVNTAQQRLAKVPAILKRFRQSVLAAACSGRLTADWRELNPETAPATTLLDLIRSKNASGNRHGGSLANMDELPATWCWTYFEELTENHDGKRIPVKADDRAKRRGKYPYYGASGIIDTIDDYLFDGRFLLIGEDGANLLSRSTPIAFPAAGQFWVNNHAHILQSRGGIPLEYLEIFINGLDLQGYVTGSAQPKLTQAALNRIPMPLPPLPEQHEIARRVGALFRQADAMEKRVAAATAQVEKLTQAILAKAFRGELVLTEAELARKEGRDYEPASALLERIRAERPSPCPERNNSSRVISKKNARRAKKHE
jgi:type I restriction enzyme S subunit